MSQLAIDFEELSTLYYVHKKLQKTYLTAASLYYKKYYRHLAKCHREEKRTLKKLSKCYRKFDHCDSLYGCIILKDEIDALRSLKRFQRKHTLAVFTREVDSRDNEHCFLCNF